ncbi:unnamed protein product [Merluccius merluccius]
MEGLFDTRGRYKQAFPPPFIIDPDSPEYLLLCRVSGKVRRKSRKRGSRSGVQHIHAAVCLDHYDSLGAYTALE